MAKFKRGGFKRRKLFRRKLKRTRGSIKRIDRRVKKLESGVEIKERTGTVIDDVCPGGGALHFLSGVTQGAGDDQRLGMDISITSLSFGIRIDTNENSGQFYDMVRVCIIKDKMPQGAFPAIAEIFDTAGSPPPNLINAFPNWAKRKRFKILYDRNFTVGFPLITEETSSTVVGTGYPPFKFTRHTLKMHLKSRTNGTTNSINVAESNHLYLFVCSSDNATPYPTIKFNSRIKFKDD